MARALRARSRPTSSITTAIRGRVSWAGAGTAFLIQAGTKTSSCGGSAAGTDGMSIATGCAGGGSDGTGGNGGSDESGRDASCGGKTENSAVRSGAGGTASTARGGSREAPAAGAGRGTGATQAVDAGTGDTEAMAARPEEVK